ncbi:arginine--tRNA ligase [Zhaonella formicivorans]|uniref:arginine--tRNA ligase n=1 Tax=Zhaonella formicivorans TaxID=2528593 RepID=UPI001D1061E3|nr:arginine--tRNA ligase [Zhaonella formicivorans]
MDIVQSIENRIKEALAQAAEAAKEAGELSFGALPDFVLEVPREKNHGDFATNLAMLLTREAKKAPRQIADSIVKYFNKQGTWVKDIAIAGPGFINFRLDSRWLYKVIPQVLEEGQAYGTSNVGQGKKVQVEFVSANPTGLLHMGNARGAALGDTIASLLSAAGFDVTREYYINDAGNQIENFGLSLEARYLQALGQDVPFPEEGYHGEDLIATVQGFIKEHGEKYLESDPQERRGVLVQYALHEKLSHIRNVLAEFGVNYDVWFSEKSLHDSGAVARVIEELRSKGYIYEKDGALWFKTTEFGDEKDEVVVRANGVPTYFAADIAYHLNKFERGFEWVINLWGADHHGHVARMKGAVKALGYNPDRLDVVLMQLVRLFSGGELVRMSKRTGQYVTLSELMEEVGRDAARYFFVMRSADSHLDFDLDLAKSQSAENPVFYVQYAHARICSILRQAKEAGVTVPALGEANPELLQDPSELELLRKIADFPGLIAGAAVALEPHRLTRYAHELAGLFHSFYTNCRVLNIEPELSAARLQLVEATRITLNNLLNLIGVSAPERM